MVTGVEGGSPLTNFCIFCNFCKLPQLPHEGANGIPRIEQRRETPREIVDIANEPEVAQMAVCIGHDAVTHNHLREAFLGLLLRYAQVAARYGHVKLISAPSKTALPHKAARNIRSKTHQSYRKL